MGRSFTEVEGEVDIMCGINGCIVRSNERHATEVYYKLLRESDIRGQDGTGITILRKGEFINIRWEGRAKNIPNNTLLPLRIGDKIIGQNRYSIFGLDFTNNQPLNSSEFSLVHNGVLYDYEEQFKKLELRREKKVDSELILRLFEYCFNREYPVATCKTILDLFNGEASCLVLYKGEGKSFLISFMKNKILYSGEDIYGNTYFFSTLYIKNKVPEICNNIKDFSNYEVEIYY